MEEARGILDESAWIIAFHHWQLSIQRGDLTCEARVRFEIRVLVRVRVRVRDSAIFEKGGCGVRRDSAIKKLLKIFLFIFLIYC